MPFSCELLNLILGEHFVALGQDFAALGVQDVVGHHLAHQVHGDAGDIRHPGPLHLLDEHRGQAFAFLDQDLAALGVRDVVGRGLVHQQLRDELAADGFRLQRHLLRLVEEVEQLFGGVTQGLQQDGGRELAPPVDPDVQDVFGVELKVDPGAPQGDEAGRVDDLAAGVNLGPVVVDEQTRGAVQLAHHHPLGAVDDKGAVFRHQGQGAEIDLLLLDVPNGLGLGFRAHLVDHQAHPDLHGDFKGHAPLLAFVHVVLGVRQAVLHELQGTGAGEIPDGKDAFKDPLEPEVQAGRGFHVFLQETVVGLLLHLNEIGDVHYPFNLAEIFAIQP